MKKKIIPKKQRVTDAAKEGKEAKEGILKKIGKRIKNFREAMEYTQQNLASDISKSNIIPCIDNFSDKIISRHENGSSEMGIITFINYCRALHKTPNELLADYFKDTKTLKSEIMDLYVQLNRVNRSSLISYARWLLSDQGNEDRITKF